MTSKINSLLPTILESTPGRERAFDPYSRLFQERIVFLGEEVTDRSSNDIIAQLLYLSTVGPGKPIHLYIHSPGGSVTAGMAIYDTMHTIDAPVHTYAMGMAASMGALLFSGGQKGFRYALPNSRIMIHQPSGGAQGQASDITIQAQEILRWKGVLNKILADNCGRSIEEIEKASDRDHYMDAKEAMAFGIADRVVDYKVKAPAPSAAF